jgi:hypothetical protein
MYKLETEVGNIIQIRRYLGRWLGSRCAGAPSLKSGWLVLGADRVDLDGYGYS